MVIVQNTLVSDDVFESHFSCDLGKCKGACCWEGDFGAPLESAELTTIAHILPDILGLLPEENQDEIRSNGPYAYYDEPEEWGTAVMPNGACVFMTTDESGCAQCAFEIAHRSKITSFLKPISCHLYPVRIEKLNGIGSVALNYDRWDICKAACQLGQRLQIPLFRFLKSAIVRRFGESYFNEMERIFHRLNANQSGD